MQQDDVMLKNVQACLLACDVLCTLLLKGVIDASARFFLHQGDSDCKHTPTKRTQWVVCSIIFGSFEIHRSGGAHLMVRTCACLGQPPVSTRPKRIANPAVISVQPPLPAYQQLWHCALHGMMYVERPCMQLTLDPSQADAAQAATIHRADC